MAVETDHHTDSAHRGIVNVEACIRGGIVILLIEAGSLDDVYHLRDAKYRSIRIDHWRRIETPVALAQIEVGNTDDPECPTFSSEPFHDRMIDRNEISGHIPPRKLREKRAKLYLRETDDVAAVTRSLLHCIASPFHILLDRYLQR